MAKLPINLLDIINDATVMKVLATTDKLANINLVPIASFAAMDPESLICGNLFMGKTKQNMEAIKKVTLGVFKSPTESYQVKGTFQLWVTEGPIFDMMQKAIYEQMPAMLKGLAMITVDEVFSVSPMGEITKIEG